MDVDAIARAVLAARRKERRDGIWLAVIGVLFAAGGVLLIVIGGMWLGLVGICFGMMSVVSSIIMISGNEGPLSDILLIIVSLLFTAVGAFMIISGVLTPEMWGWRSGLSGIIGGALCVAFFGPGTIALIIRARRRRALRRS